MRPTTCASVALENESRAPALHGPDAATNGGARLWGAKRRRRPSAGILGLMMMIGAMGGAIASPRATAADADVDAPVVVATEPPIDLNQADVDALCRLPGIGRKKAEAIVALRERRPFTRVTQLLQVKGIGPKTLQKLKPRIVISLASDPPKAMTESAARRP
jgi:competence protein ComEA